LGFRQGDPTGYGLRRAPETLEQFELVLNTVSIEEVVEQVEREDGPSRSGSVAQTQLPQGDRDTASDWAKDGQHG
jgi:hypothetical protein